jgi:hypothetical protein
MTLTYPPNVNAAFPKRTEMIFELADKDSYAVLLKIMHTS